MNFFSSLYLSNTFYYIPVREKQFADGVAHSNLFPPFPPFFFPPLWWLNWNLQSSFSNTDSSLEIPDWFVCICSVLLVDEKGIYYGKCILILCALRNSDMTVLNRHGFKWKTTPAFSSALFFHGCVAFSTRPWLHTPTSFQIWRLFTAHVMWNCFNFSSFTPSKLIGI